jgi:hypothetical protein
MPDRKGTNADYGAHQPRISKHNSPGIPQPPPPGLRQTATFAGDLAAKQLAADRHRRRSRQEEQNLEAQHQPGPVRVPGIGASSVASHKSYDNKAKQDDDTNILTAIAVEDDEELDELEKQRIKAKAKNDVRLKIFSEAVEAEVADFEAEEKEHKQKKCRRTLTYGLIVFVLLAGGGAAIGIALSSSSPKESDAPTLAPTLSPTVRPPIFTPPPQNDTEPQTVCEGAFDIATTIGEPFFGNINEFATVAPVDTCEVIFRNGVGVWYRILGDGSRYVASTCDSTSFDTQISIFSGACGKLQCVAGNDQMARCGNGDQSLVGFATEPNLDYYIYVQARRQSQSLFKMLVDHLDSNDECEGAVPLEYFGPSVFDSTRGATVDNVECFGTVPDAPGVWYTIQGVSSGFGYQEEFRVKFDTSDTAFSFLSTMVFTGNDCGSLTCVVDGNRWLVDEDVTYYILVYGGNEASEGDYRVLVDNAVEAGFFVELQSCEDQVFLFPGASVGIDTGFQSRPEFGSCGDQVFATSTGVWYEVIGTGGPLTVSTCSSTSGFDTQISVLQGPCDGLTCVDGNDQACGDQSRVSWFSEVGITYHIAGKCNALLSSDSYICFELLYTNIK